MKKASKFLCALLAVVMTAALAVPAFASTVELEDAGGKLSITDVIRQETAEDGKPLYIVGPDSVITKEMLPDFSWYHIWLGNSKDGEGHDDDGDNYYIWEGAPEFGDKTLVGKLAYFDRFASGWTVAVSVASNKSIYDGISMDFYVRLEKAQPTQPTQPTTPTQPADPGVKPAPGVSVPLNDGSGEFAYTVKSGDNLKKIAAYYYGDANVYKLIYERNKGTIKNVNLIYAGQTIILPSYAAVAQGVASTTPAKPAAPGVKPAPGVSVPLNDGSGEFAYTVKSGDTLGRIAAYYYGNVNVYKLIYERNKDTLKSPNLIYAGQTIILPSYAAVAQGVAKI